MVRINYIARKSGVAMRKAFTMIELIFAIVVISVVVLTIPMMIQVNNKALEGNSAQEAIFLVSTVLSSLTTRLWDINSSQQIDSGFSISGILDVNGTGNAVYNRMNANTPMRVGGVRGEGHRQFFAAYSRPNVNDNTTISFDESSIGESLGLKNTYDLTVNRVYISDNPIGFVFTVADIGVQTNIKMTEVIVKGDLDADGVDEEITVLRAYTCNIGEVDFHSKEF